MQIFNAVNALIIFIPSLIIIGLFIKRKNKLAFHLLLLSLITVIINIILKELLRVGEVQVSEGFRISRYQFPSLSVQIATTFWLHLSMQVKRKKILWYLTSFLIITLVAYQKLITHQHTIGDVGGGLILGLGVIFLFRLFTTQREDTWTRSAIAERFPDPLSPLFGEVITEVYSYAARKALIELGISNKSVPQYKIFNGYIYHNVDLKKLSKVGLLKLVAKFYSLAGKTASEFYQEILPDDITFFTEGENMRWERMSSEELLEYFEIVKEKFKERMAYESRVAFFLEGVSKILSILIKLVLGKNSHRYPYMQSLLSQEDNASTKVDREIGALVREASESPMRGLFETHTSHALMNAVKEDARAQNFCHSFNRFLNCHHYRFVNYDFVFPTWGEAPVLVMDIVRNHVLQNVDIEKRMEAEKVKKERMLASITQTFTKSILKRMFLEKIFWRWLALAEKYNLLKEARYDSRMMYFYFFKKIVKQIGHNILKKAYLEKEDDIFFLYYDEVEDLIIKNRESERVDVRQKIIDRKQLHQQQYHMSPPTTFVGESAGNWPEVISSTKELRGIIASKGSVTAVCKLIKNPEEFGKLNKGEILVARTTNPAWTPLFALAGGVITEVGGLLSHAAIVAREYGIPALVNVHNVTKVFKDGDVVNLDAEKGRATVLR